MEIIETPFLVETSNLDDRPYCELLAGKRYLLFFGTLNPMKGVPLIAQIIRSLLSSHPELFFVFIGKECGGYLGKSMMQHVWEEAGPYRGRVLYLGQLRHEQLYPILANALAVVLPSRVDNLPNTCLEAMAHRRVVIGTRGTGFEQLITEGRNGFLCDSESSASLLEALEKTLRMTDEERHRMGEEAWQRVHQFRPEIVVNQLISFYQRVLDTVAKNSSRG